MTLVDQLIDFYYKYDAFQDSYLDREEASGIYQILLDRNRLHLYLDNSGVLLGYGESWRIDYTTFGRIICGHNLYKEISYVDIENGNIAYLANVTIHPEWRKTNVLRMLRNDFFSRNYMCDYFCGWAKRKKTQPVKVFTRQQAFAKWVNKEESHGRV